MSTDFMTTGEVARLLGVPEHRVQTLIRFELIEIPAMFGNRRMWTPAHVEAARRVLVERGALAPERGDEAAKS